MVKGILVGAVEDSNGWRGKAASEHPWSGSDDSASLGNARHGEVVSEWEASLGTG